MSQHTQEPWVSTYANDTGPDDDYFVEFYEINALDGTEIAKVRSEADARLMAAAPEMLIALTQMLDSYYIPSVRQQARAAIAKATGEQP
jgi:hypothetical protein